MVEIKLQFRFTLESKKMFFYEITVNARFCDQKSCTQSYIYMNASYKWLLSAQVRSTICKHVFKSCNHSLDEISSSRDQTRWRLTQLFLMSLFSIKIIYYSIMSLFIK